MITYNLYTIQDLKKFITFCSYEFRNNLQLLSDLKDKLETFENQQELTKIIKNNLNHNKLKTDILDQIKSKNESIKRLQQEVEILIEADKKLSTCNSFEECFKSLLD